MTELVRPTHLLDELARNGVYDNGLHLNDPAATLDQFVAVGGLLRTAHSDVRMAMGDWLLMVEERWPDEFSQTAEILDINEEARSEYMRTCRGIPRSMRRKDKRISYSHYRALSGLKTVDTETGEVLPDRARQRELLDQMEQAEGRISHHRLRDMLRPEPDTPPDPPTDCRCCGRPL